MPNQPFFPKAEADQIAWCTNYASKIATHGPVCGETPANIAAAQADLAYYVWVIKTWHPQIKSDGVESTAYKKLIAQGGVSLLSPVPAPAATVFAGPTAPPPLVAPGVLRRLFEQVARLKVSAGYLANSEAIGQDLNIIGAPDTTEHPAPEFKLTVEDGPTWPGLIHLDEGERWGSRMKG